MGVMGLGPAGRIVRVNVWITSGVTAWRPAGEELGHMLYSAAASRRKVWCDDDVPWPRHDMCVDVGRGGVTTLLWTRPFRPSLLAQGLCCL